MNRARLFVRWRPRLALRGRAVAFAVALLAFVVTLPARAQRDRPELHFRADADVVGLGDVVHLTLQAMSPGNMPSDPRIGSTGGFVVTGMSPSTSTQMSIVNGMVTSQRGLTTVWTLRAMKLGTFTIGPPTVTVNGTRYRGQSLSLRVLPAGQVPQRSQQQQNPFDPFGGLFGQFPQLQIPGFEEPQQREPQLPPMDPRFALDSPRAPTAFLHALIDKPSAAVGEQVTYTVYIYVDTSIGRDMDLNDPHEAPASDFVKRSLQPDDSKVTLAGYANVGGKIFAVQLLRKSALFPLKTGDLDIGEMTLQIGGSAGGLRRSEDLHVHVTEPPVQGRPPGYAMGDVGTFSLAADLSGRDIEQDGAIGVTVTLSGTGNLPASLLPPEKAGVEWLDQQMIEKLGPQGDKFAGSRTFQYVVRIHRAGEVNLGDFTLPYWDPQARVYQIARAPLGSIHVRPSATPSGPAEAVNDPLPNLPQVRATREGVAGPHRHFDDAPVFWMGLGALPLAYAIALGASNMAKRVRERRAVRGASPQTELRTRIRAAEDASAKGNARVLDAATARALEAAAIAGCKVNVRGLGTSEVAHALADAGVDAGDASEVEAILRACDTARFSSGGDRAASGADASPGVAGDTETGEARERWTRARRTIDRLAGRP